MTAVSTLARMAHGASRRESLQDPSKVIGLAIERACDQAAGLDSHMAEVQCKDVQFKDALAQIDPSDLLCKLRRNGRFVGVVTLCPQLCAALVEMQALGQINDQAAEPRAPSGTDAALCRPMITRFLTELVETAQGTQLDGVVDGLAVGDRLHSARTIELTLTEAPMTEIALSVRLADTERTGALRLIIPPEPELPEVAPCAEATQSDWNALWSDVAQSVPAKLEAVLHQMMLGLDQVNSLSPGDVLPLPGASVGGVILIDRAGARVARARLGQVAGSRAVRIETGEAPAENLEDLVNGGAGTLDGADLMLGAVDGSGGETPDMMADSVVDLAGGLDLPEVDSTPLDLSMDPDASGLDLPVADMELPDIGGEAPAADFDFDAPDIDLPGPLDIDASGEADAVPDFPAIDLGDFD